MIKLKKKEIFRTAFHDENGKLLFHVEFCKAICDEKEKQDEILEQILKSGDPA